MMLWFTYIQAIRMPSSGSDDAAAASLRCHVMHDQVQRRDAENAETQSSKSMHEINA